MTKSADIAGYMLVCDPNLNRQPQKLAALVYLAHAHNLGTTGQPLYEEPTFAAVEGPVPGGLVRFRHLMRPWSHGSRTPRLRRMPR